jgi:hypothetical protein
LLGLAGLSDNIVEWQDWFEQGVMEHWRSVKEWTIAVLLWWLPFRVSSWCIDYFVISAIVLRASPMPRWNEGWTFGPSQAREHCGRVPFSWKLEWAMSHIIQRVPYRVLIFFIWPIALPVLSIEALRGRAFAAEVEIDADRRKRDIANWLTKIAWGGISFIPILFVCSNLLYEHG